MEKLEKLGHRDCRDDQVPQANLEIRALLASLVMMVCLAVLVRWAQEVTLAKTVQLAPLDHPDLLARLETGDRPVHLEQEVFRECLV